MKETQHISVLGAGNIGTSLAILFAVHGLDVTVVGVDASDLQRSRDICTRYLDTLIDQGLMTAEQVDTSQGRICFTNDYRDIAHTDFVYEGVLEKADIKWSVYQKIEQYCPGVVAIASTTSAITPDVLCQGLTKYRDRLVVAHPWNPPHMVPFVEMLAGEDCAPQVVEYVLHLLERVGRKVVVMKKSAPGFVGNRLQYAMYREAVYMVEQGIATPQDIDMSLLYGFGPRYTSVGLFEHFDNCGLDLARSIEEGLFPELCSDKAPSQTIVQLVEQGHIGAKSGQGFYAWDRESESSFRQRTSQPYFEYFTHTGGVRSEGTAKKA